MPVLSVFGGRGSTAHSIVPGFRNGAAALCVVGSRAERRPEPAEHVMRTRTAETLRHCGKKLHVSGGLLSPMS